jgi:hypothetical protein
VGLWQNVEGDAEGCVNVQICGFVDVQILNYAMFYVSSDKHTLASPQPLSKGEGLRHQ